MEGNSAIFRTGKFSKKVVSVLHKTNYFLLMYLYLYDI